VLNERFETIAHDRARGLDLVTVRAVKTDSGLFDAVHRLMTPMGRLFLFHSPDASPQPPDSLFLTVQTARLGTAGDARLSILKPLFHVEQSR
jgi:hypothetical protein